MYGSGGYGSGGGGGHSSRYNYGHGPPNSYPSSRSTATRVASAPPKTDEIRDMINNLRVEELKKFLAHAEKDYRGKKSELQDRALEVVNSGRALAPDLLEVLKGLHRQRSNDRRPDHLISTDPWASYSSSSSAVDSVSGYRKSTIGVAGSASGTASATTGLPVYHQSSNTSSSNYRSMPAISSLFAQPSPMTDIPGRNPHPSSAVGGAKSSATYDPISYYHNITASSKIPVPSTKPLTPSVTDLKFTPLPFFEEKSVVTAPQPLTPKHDSRTGYHELNLNFTLTATQANEISSSRKVTPGISPGLPGAVAVPKVEFGTQLLIRFAMATFGATGDREVTEDCIPLNMNIKVNGKSVPISILPVDKRNPGVQFKMTRPLEITQFCKISPLNPNNLQLTWQHPTLATAHGVMPAPLDHSKTFCLSTFIVRRLSSEDLVKKVRSKGPKHREFTASLIRDKLKDADDEIATTSLRAQLICPLGKMRIQTPARSTVCTHIQCFDVHLFLQMNERKPTWSCPVCDKKIPFQTLVVDGLFTEILDSNRSERFTEVAFLEKSGASQGFTTIEWEPIIKEEKTVKQEPKTECGGKRHATAPIDLSPKSTSAQAKKSKKDEPEVIDLLSSDEEDGKTEGAMDLRHNSPDESDDTIVDGTSDDDTDDDDEYFADVYRRSKKGGGRNEAIDRQLRSGESRAMSTATSSNTAGRQMPLQLPPMHEDSDDSDLICLD